MAFGGPRRTGKPPRSNNSRRSRARRYSLHGSQSNSIRMERANDIAAANLKVLFVPDLSEAKRAEEALREQANLLNVTHGTVFVMNMGR